MTDPDQPSPPSAPPRRPKAKRAPPAPRAGLVGPLFSWELLRLARRGQDARARFILAVALFFVLTAFTLIYFRESGPLELFFGGAQELSIQQSATFGESFSLAFVLGQLGVLVLLTPAYAAGGIAEEKDKKTYAFLLVSDLTNREIVFGKFLGRTAFLLGVLFAGLPILAITQLHGGVSPMFLLFSYLITGTTVVLLSAVGAAAAAAAETFRGGLFRAYAVTAVIVLTGYGVYPVLSPFGVIPIMFACEANTPGLFWTIAVGYPVLQLGLTALAVWRAVAAVRRSRVKLTRVPPKPPAYVRDRYRDEDREKARRERAEEERREQATLEAERRRAIAAGPVVLDAEEEHAEGELDVVLVEDGPPPADLPTAAAVGEPVRLKASRIPVAAVTAPPPDKGKASPPPPAPADRRWDSEPDRDDRNRRRRRYRDPRTHADGYDPRPKVGDEDPFYWKEKHTTGAVKTQDDEAMRTMTYLVGGIIGLVVLFFLMIAVIAVVSGGSEKAGALARWLLLSAGAAGMFAHLLQIGLSACGAVCRERQRLTLESLLTIPVPRRAILWPKWLHAMLRGWWWGGPAAAVVLVAFLSTPAPVVAVAAAVVLLAAAPFAASYGLWLSVRSPSVNRAIMWFLPAAGLLVVLPLAACGWLAEDTWPLVAALLLALGVLLVGGTAVFWRLSEKAFDHETVFGPAKG